MSSLCYGTKGPFFQLDSEMVLQVMMLHKVPVKIFLELCMDFGIRILTWALSNKSSRIWRSRLRPEC